MSVLPMLGTLELVCREEAARLHRAYHSRWFTTRQALLKDLLDMRMHGRITTMVLPEAAPVRKAAACLILD